MVVSALRQPWAIARDDVALITLYHLVNSWAGRPTLSYQARTDEQTYAVDVHEKR